jgi:hypothetical protein
MADHAAHAEVTSVLEPWTSGRTDALERVTPLVDPGLIRLVRYDMRHERANHTLQPIACQLEPC